MTTRFTLEPGSWYAMELFGQEFGDEVRHCSPIRVDSVTPMKTGQGRFQLSFFHSTNTAGRRDEVLTLQTIQRSRFYLMARVTADDRMVLIFDLSQQWLEKHFVLEPEEPDPQRGGTFQALPDTDLKEILGPSNLESFGEVHWSSEFCDKHGLPDIGYPVPHQALKYAAVGEVNIGFEELLYWLQLYTEMDKSGWLGFAPAMNALAANITGESTTDRLVIEDEKHWLELGPIDLESSDIVTLQRGDTLLGAFEKITDNQLRFAAFQPLDGRAIRLAWALAKKPGVYDYDRVDPTKWDSACHLSTKIGQFYAAQEGISYVSRWEYGLGISSTGEEEPDWVRQRGLQMLPTGQVAVQINVYLKFQSLLETST